MGCLGEVVPRVHLPNLSINLVYRSGSTDIQPKRPLIEACISILDLDHVANLEPAYLIVPKSHDNRSSLIPHKGICKSVLLPALPREEGPRGTDVHNLHDKVYIAKTRLQ